MFGLKKLDGILYFTRIQFKHWCSEAEGGGQRKHKRIEGRTFRYLVVLAQRVGRDPVVDDGLDGLLVVHVARVRAVDLLENENGER